MEKSQIMVHFQMILEIGCGAGFSTLAIASKGIQALSIDIIPEAIQITEKLLSENAVPNTILGEGNGAQVALKQTDLFIEAEKIKEWVKQFQIELILICNPGGKVRAYVSADNSKESSDSVIQKALDLYENHDPHYTRTLFPYYMYVITTNLIIDKYIDTYPEEISHIFYALIDLEIYMSVNHGTDSELFVYSCQSAAFSIWSSFLRHYCTDAQVALGKEEQKRLCQIVTILLCSLCGYYNESYANKLPSQLSHKQKAA